MIEILDASVASRAVLGALEHMSLAYVAVVLVIIYIKVYLRVTSHLGLSFQIHCGVSWVDDGSGKGVFNDKECHYAKDAAQATSQCFPIAIGLLHYLGDEHNVEGQ